MEPEGFVFLFTGQAILNRTNLYCRLFFLKITFNIILPYKFSFRSTVKPVFSGTWV